jgi:hypothetical protein
MQQNGCTPAVRTKYVDIHLYMQAQIAKTTMTARQVIEEIYHFRLLCTNHNLRQLGNHCAV